MAAPAPSNRRTLFTRTTLPPAALLLIYWDQKINYSIELRKPKSSIFHEEALLQERTNTHCGVSHRRPSSSSSHTMLRHFSKYSSWQVSKFVRYTTTAPSLRLFSNVSKRNDDDDDDDYENSPLNPDRSTNYSTYVFYVFYIY